MASSNKLTFIGAASDEQSPHSAGFSGILAQWYSTEDRLQNIYKKLDAAIGDNPETQSSASDLMKIQIEIEQEQRSLLTQIARLPAQNVSDMIAKLEIWKSLIMPDGSDPSLSQPSDQIVHSVLSDLLSGAAQKS